MFQEFPNPNPRVPILLLNLSKKKKKKRQDAYQTFPVAVYQTSFHCVCSALGRVYNTIPLCPT